MERPLNLMLFKCLQDMDNRNRMILKRRQLVNKILIKRKLELDLMIKLHQHALENLLTIYTNPVILFESMLNAIPPKTIWMKNRSSQFWPKTVMEFFSDADWIENFRMSKSTFLTLCTVLTEVLEPKPTILMPREPVSVQKQVAVGLYTLARSIKYREVGNLFAIEKGTVRKCVQKLVRAINTVMMPTYIKMPNEQEMPEIANYFEATSGIPGILGCCDIIHIPILAPFAIKHEYENTAGWTSLNFQAVVDNQSRFRDVSIQHGGSASYSTVLQDSNFFKKNREIFSSIVQEVGGYKIPYFFIVGNSAYPLLPWLIKEHNGILTPMQETFNERLRSLKAITVENAFRRLKARWGILCQKISLKIDFVPEIVSACCVLHNFVESKSEPFQPEWLNMMNESQTKFQQPEAICFDSDDLIDGVFVRNYLTNYIAEL